jgi:hypothetical protein
MGGYDTNVSDVGIPIHPLVGAIAFVTLFTT